MAGIDPLSVGLTAAGTVAKLATLPSSIRSQRKLEGELANLRKTPMARYTIDPKIESLYRQSMGDASNPQGFGGATYSGFRNNLGRIQRGRFGNATSMSGGQGSRAINAVLGGQEMDALNNYYVADENLRRSNRLGGLNRAQGYASQFQNIKNMNTSNDISYRMQLERGLGEGIRSQKDYRRNMFGSMGSDLLTAGIMSGYGGGRSTVDPDLTDIDYTTGMGGINRGRFGSNLNTDLISRRNKMRGMGAYNSRNFDFGGFDDGSPVRVR